MAVLLEFYKPFLNRYEKLGQLILVEEVPGRLFMIGFEEGEEQLVVLFLFGELDLVKEKLECSLLLFIDPLHELDDLQVCIFVY